MNTSNSSLTPPAGLVALAGLGSGPGAALPEDFPGEAELSRLASELFNALPQTWVPGETCPELARQAVTAQSIGARQESPPPGGKPRRGDGPAQQTPPSALPFAESFAESFAAPPAAPSAEAFLGAAVPRFEVPLPGVRELEALAAYVKQVERSRQVLRQPYYFIEAEPQFAPGIEVPGSYGHERFLPPQALPGQAFDVQALRRDFPILKERVNGRPLIWLDNAATTQKPESVIERIRHFYTHENSNIHRAAHELAARATDAYETARESVRRFINARSANEVVFVRGTTEGINLVAQSWGRQHLKPGDEILITWLEHHANIVPWQQLAAQTGAVLKVAPVDDLGQVRLEEYERLLGPRTRLVSFTQVSNALGTVTPAREMVRLAHAQGAKVLVDGAQSVSHLRADVQALDCDWFVFSGHKVFGPTGIGVVYGKEALLNATEPWQGGGNMIRDVTFERTLYHAAPARFEAGTGNIADAVGLGAALEYVERVGIDNIARHEHDLLRYGTRLLEDIPGLRLIGKAADKAGVLSFVLEGYKTEEVGAALNREGIAVRSGHHCAQPILRRFGVEATVRPSLALYNTQADLDALAAAVRQLQRAKGVRG